MSEPSSHNAKLLYQISVSIKEGEVHVTEDAFEAEMRGAVYKPIQHVQGRVKMIVRMKLGRIQERPVCSTNPSGIGFLVIYDAAEKRDDLLKSIFESAREKLDEQRASLNAAYAALDACEEDRLPAGDIRAKNVA